MDFQKYHGVIDWLKNSPFVIGFLGSMTALMFEPKLSIRRTSFLLFTGTVCAGYLAPFVAEVLHFESPNAQAAIAFITGTMGMRLVGGLIVLAEKFRKDPTALLRIIAIRFGIKYPEESKEKKSK